MNNYTVGARLFCDFAFGGKPKAKCVEVIESGVGNKASGKVLVELTETVGAYGKGERLVLNAVQAVPLQQEQGRRAGEYFRRVNTQYAWVKGGAK